MKFKHLLLSLISCITFSANAQSTSSRTISGTIYSDPNGTATAYTPTISSVNVICKLGADTVATENADSITGAYSFSGLNDNENYTIVISDKRYLLSSVDYTTLSSQVKTLDVPLTTNDTLINLGVNFLSNIMISYDLYPYEHSTGFPTGLPYADSFTRNMALELTMSVLDDEPVKYIKLESVPNFISSILYNGIEYNDLTALNTVLPNGFSAASYDNGDGTYYVYIDESLHDVRFKLNSGGNEMNGSFTYKTIDNNDITSELIVVNADFNKADILGTVVLDGNGDNTTNGITTNLFNGYFVNVIDTFTNKVKHVYTVNANGAWGTGNILPLYNGTYYYKLSNIAGVIDQLDNSSLPDSIQYVGRSNTYNQTIDRADLLDSDFIIVNGGTVSGIFKIFNVAPQSMNQTMVITGVPSKTTPEPLTAPLQARDKELIDAGGDWTFTGVGAVITSLPTNGFKLIYDGMELALNDTISNYSPSLLAVQATNSTPDTAKTAVFNYKVIDPENAISFNEGTYVVSYSQALPLHFTKFEATSNNCEVVLNWEYALSNNSYVNQFEIEGSKDGHKFGKIGVTTASANNQFFYNNEASLYQYFRIVGITDAIHKEYSNIQKVNIEHCVNSAISAYPNPVSQVLNIKLAAATQQASYFIKDIAGRTIHHGTISGATQVLIEHLPNGTYILELLIEGVPHTEKIIKL